MRIVLAASIYPPEVGGPAQYAANLKEALEKRGHEISLAVFAAYRHLPAGMRHAAYAIRLFRLARGAGAIIAFDAFTTGAPALLAGKLARTPVIARVGGDFLWERYVERTGDRLPLPFFYEHAQRWSMRDRLVFRIQRIAARRLLLAFTSRWQLEIWRAPYKLDSARCGIVENAIPPKIGSFSPEKKNFLFFGRQIKLKNAETFRRAFARAQARHPDITLEEGMLPREELLERMRRAYAIVLPSVSDVTPNYIIDALRLGKPFLLTKHSAYAERFGRCGVIVDPLSEDDMADGVERLADPAAYEEVRARAAAFSEERSFDDVAQAYLRVLNSS